MFSSKPVQRTTDPALLKQKAIEFLDKNYTRVKPGEAVPYDFYMLEPKSINGMKKIRCEGKDRYPDPSTNTSKFNATVTYKNFDGSNNNPQFETIIIDEARRNPIWYRNMSMFGNSASDAILGGTRRRKSRRNRRKQRKSYRR